MRTRLMLGALLLSLSAQAQEAGAPAPVDAPAAAAAEAPTAPFYVGRLDDLWKTRDDAASIKAHDEVIRDGLKAFPGDYEILWRAARYRWWVSDGVTEEKMKKQTAKEGWNFAKRAVEAKPGASEGKYYVALNIGAYSQAVGILKALGEGLEGQFVDNLDAATKLNESFDRWGGHTAKGRYHWELPWPKRNLGKSKAEIQMSIDKHPEHLRNYYYLAATLLKDGDAKGAKATLEKAINGSDAYDPPESRRVKAWAKVLGAEIDKELK